MNFFTKNITGVSQLRRTTIDIAVPAWGQLPTKVLKSWEKTELFEQRQGNISAKSKFFGQ